MGTITVSLIRQRALFMTGKTPDAFSGETPTTKSTVAPTETSYGCAISLRTLQYHSHPRWWTGAAARRQGAAVSSMGKDSSEIELRSKPISGCPSF